MAPTPVQQQTRGTLLADAEAAFLAGRREESAAVALGAAGAPENIVGAAIAYERGDLEGCARILGITGAGFAAGAREQLAERQWRELQTYRTYLDLLVTYRRQHPEPPTRSREPLYLVGDSHVLSPARFPLRLAGRPMVAVPRLVFGVKAWHLARAHAGEANLYAAAFARALQALPEGAQAAISVGEIDCRADEGFLPALRRDGALNPQEMQGAIHETVANAIAFAEERASEAGLELHAINVPAPRRDAPDRDDEDSHAVADIVRTYNRALGEVARGARLSVLDVYRESAGADGFAAPGKHLDSVHLVPSVLAKAAVAPRRPRA